jgi:hypothetical protein
MASRSVPASFNGMACPEAVQIGFTHGPNAAQATVKVTGNLSSIPLGSPGTIQVDNSAFFGFLVNTEYTWGDQSTTLRYVDWRDRMHDVLVFAALNMQEDDGRFYHIMPDKWDEKETSQDWSTQRKTYVTREVEQDDFNTFSNLSPDTIFNLSVGKDNLYSAFNILNWIGKKYQFRMVAEQTALNILKKSFPLNLDWNAGATVAEAVNQVLEKLNMQQVALPSGVLYVSIRGFSESAFANALANGLVNPCLTGSDSPSLGSELSERGRRVKIIGDHNKYEWTYLCQQNWNPAWTWDIAFGGAKLSALLKKYSLTRFSKLKEMPTEYKDFETWTDAENTGEGALTQKRTRNEMTIQEYIDKIVYKAYVVDFTKVVGDLATTKKDVFSGKTYRIDRERAGLQLTEEVNGKTTKVPSDEHGRPSPIGDLSNYSVTDLWDNSQLNSLYPLSRTLVTDSDLQFLVYATNRKIIRGAEHPFSDQHTMVPKNGGVSLDVEEVLRYTDGKNEHRVRLFFNQPQFYVDKKLKEDDPKRIQPDKIAVRISVDREIFQWGQGEKYNGIRVREQRVSVRNLYKAAVNGEEVTVLKENFIENLKKDGSPATGQSGVRADDLAKKIATQALFHQSIVSSGTMDFKDRAGFMPDGLIDSVTVSFSAQTGIEEVLNFSNSWNAREQIYLPIVGKVSTKRKFEDDIIRDRLRDLAKAAMKDKGVAVRNMTVMENGLHEPGALYGTTVAGTAFGARGILAVSHPKAAITKREIKPRTLIPFKKPKTTS